MQNSYIMLALGIRKLATLHFDIKNSRTFENLKWAYRNFGLLGRVVSKNLLKRYFRDKNFRILNFKILEGTKL